MGDLVIYDNTGTRYERLWVPDREKRYWLRFWRAQGKVALTLNQWRRQGERPWVTPRKPLNKRAYWVRIADSAARISFVERYR